jgi:hypothetical protein
VKLVAKKELVKISGWLLKMPVLAKLINADLSRGFTVGSVLYISHEWHEWDTNKKIKLGGSKA